MFSTVDGELLNMLAPMIELMGSFLTFMSPLLILVTAVSILRMLVAIARNLMLHVCNIEENEDEDEIKQESENMSQRALFAKQTEQIESMLESISHADISLQGKKLIKQAKRVLSFLPKTPQSDTLGKLTSYYMPETLALLGKFERLEEQGVLKEVNVENISASLKTVTKIIQQVIAETAEPDVMDINVGSAVLIKMSKLNGLDDENPFGQKSA